jgi:hypothetical protein
MIVIEGMDNSGKSTLGLAMAAYLEWPLQESEGPPCQTADMTADEEINARVDKYFTFPPTVFVRHPVISNSIYGHVRDEGDPITEERRVLFGLRKPILIYCDAGTRGLESHIRKAHDTDKHMDDITDGYHTLLELYRLWAAQHAHFIYRIGDEMDLLIRLVNYRLGWDGTSL